MNDGSFFTILSFMFTWVWRFLTSAYIPGTNLTPAALLLFPAVTFISLKFITSLFGTGSVSGSNAVHAQRTREGRPKKSK